MGLEQTYYQERTKQWMYRRMGARLLNLELIVSAMGVITV